MPPYSRDQKISTLNSTTTPLANGQTFTGEWEQNPFPDVLCSLKTDQSGILYFVADTDQNNTIITMRFSLNEYQNT